MSFFFLNFFSLYFFKICSAPLMWIDTRVLSKGFDSRIDKRRLIFADPPPRVTQTKKDCFLVKSVCNLALLTGNSSFVASNKQRSAKRMYLPNSAFNLAFNVPFHANCHEKLSQLKCLRMSSLSREIQASSKYELSRAIAIKYDVILAMRHVTYESFILRRLNIVKK